MQFPHFLEKGCQISTIVKNFPNFLSGIEFAHSALSKNTIDTIRSAQWAPKIELEKNVNK